MARKKTVLVVVAHADDLEFLAGGIVARFVKEKGYDVYEYILTDNSKGSYRLSGEELIAVSAREAVEAGEVLGLKEVRLEGYVDGELNEAPVNEVRGKVMGMIHEVKADIVMSWDPFAPYEDNPDHRVVGMSTYEAASFSGGTLFHPENTFEPHHATEAYWFAKSPWNADKFVDISSTIDEKIEALLKHECQMHLTVDGICKELETVGADLSLVEEIKLNGHEPFIDREIRRFFGNLGKQAGFEYAEQFRYEAIGMASTVLGLDVAEVDF
jgi:LmbE family N-acetylglucosaminyl deacetylase